MIDSEFMSISPYRMRSQNFTYAMEIKKKATVIATKIMSRMSVFSNQSER
jgi:hypothetical protein